MVTINTGLPHHAHDCETCKYQGSFSYNNQNFDVYLHGEFDEHTVPTIIARYSSDGPAYASCPLDLISVISVELLIAFNVMLRTQGLTGTNAPFVSGSFFSNNHCIFVI